MDCSVAGVLSAKYLFDFFAFLIIAGVVVLVLKFIFSLVAPTVSKYYRKYLTDLYVASVIREKSKEQELDLASEEKNFNLYIKSNNKRYLKDLDDKIEQSLSDDIESKFEKKKEDNPK